MSYPIDDLEALIFEMLERIDCVEAWIRQSDSQLQEQPVVVPRAEVTLIFSLIDSAAPFQKHELSFLRKLAIDAGSKFSRRNAVTARRRLVLSPKQWKWLRLLRVKYPRPAPATLTAAELQKIPDNMLN